MRGNQMRLYLSSMAYILVSGQRSAAAEPEGDGIGAGAGVHIRTKLLKIGAQIRVTVRKVWVSMPSSYPWQDLYHQFGPTCAAETRLRRDPNLPTPPAEPPASEECAATAVSGCSLLRRGSNDPDSGPKASLFFQIRDKSASAPLFPTRFCASPVPPVR